MTNESRKLRIRDMVRMTAAMMIPTPMIWSIRDEADVRCFQTSKSHWMAPVKARIPMTLMTVIPAPRVMSPAFLPMMEALIRGCGGKEEHLAASYQAEIEGPDHGEGQHP